MTLPKDLASSIFRGNFTCAASSGVKSGKWEYTLYIHIEDTPNKNLKVHFNYSLYIKTLKVNFSYGLYIGPIYCLTKHIIRAFLKLSSFLSIIKS